MRSLLPWRTVLAILLVIVVSQPIAAARQAAEEPRNVTVLVGFGQDTVNLLSFFPREIRIRAGDTVTWNQNSDSAHTVSFLGPFPGPGGGTVFLAPGEVAVPANNLPVPGRPGVNYANPVRVYPFPGPEVLAGTIYSPGEFISSGRLASIPQTPGLPELQSFSLTFDTPGTYPYLCMTHTDEMLGFVEVLDTRATNVPSQAEIDAQAQAELGVLVGLVERAKLQRTVLRSEPGPGDTNIWFVSAGNSFFRLNDTRVRLEEFMPQDLTITSGDSVVWGSTAFHSVTFNPTPPPPPLTLFETLEDGTPAIVNNEVVFQPSKPTGVFDPTKWYVSGNLSRGQPVGTAWTLTFETPGTFDYYCSVHRDLGMVGSITVLPRS